MTEQELIANTAQEIKGLGPLPRLDLVSAAMEEQDKVHVPLKAQFVPSATDVHAASKQLGEEREIEGPDLGRGSAFLVTEPHAVLVARVNDLESRLDRLIDHVNKEIGVAQDVPLHERLECIEKLLNVTREKIKEKTKLLD